MFSGVGGGGGEVTLEIADEIIGAEAASDALMSTTDSSVSSWCPGDDAAAAVDDEICMMLSLWVLWPLWSSVAIDGGVELWLRV